ncbi:MAG: stage II sporulation protein P [Clostridiales bacterium]|nr:stage II sporulation protein P [Clostridiales bacterium]
MGKTGKRALKRSAAVLLAASCFTIVAGQIPRDTLMAIGQRMAILSAGLQQPEGGAVALSGRLERQPSGGSAPTTSGSRQPSGDDSSHSGSAAPDGADSPPSASGSEPPPRAEGGGDVVEETLTTGSSFVQGIATKNASSKTIDVAAELAQKPDLGLANTEEPQVLIMHTHTTEAYMTYYAGYYNPDDPSRSSDNSRNVVAVGEALAEALRGQGIGVIHDATVHDSPKYTGAYERSAATVKALLEQYPSIRVVLDLHRDAIMRGGSAKVKPTVEINGKKAAQIMLISSVTDTASVPHPDWEQNLRFALRLQSAVHNQYPELARPLYLVDSRYNQHLTHGSLLVEVGSDSNTLEEAVYSGQLLGITLGQVLGELGAS